jgi:membrane associated rhomboid family serine protease
VLPLHDNVPTRSFPIVTVGLIVANFVVWFWELGGRGLDYHVFQDGYYPCKLEGPCHIQAPFPVHPLPWWQGAFSSMFMHASWQHILGNMLFLWIFGNNVEDALGPIRFLLWYVAGGLAATALQTFVTLSVAGASAASVPNIGASGAISAVLGAYFLLLPNAKVLTLIFFFILREIQAFWFLFIWIGFQIFDGGFALEHPEAGGGVAFFAHIGGFAFGMLTIYAVAKRRPLRPSY